MHAENNPEALTKYFLQSTKRLEELDALVAGYLEANVHRKLFPEPVEYHLDRLWKQAYSRLTKCYADISELAEKDCSTSKEILGVFRNQISDKEASFSAISELSSILSSSKIIPDGPLKIALDTIIALYQRIVISKFVNTDSTIHWGCPDHSIVRSSADKAIESALLTGLRPKTQFESWLSTFSIEALQLSLATSKSDVSESNLAKELEQIVGWVSVVREQLLKAAFSQGGVSELDVIADNARLAQAQGFSMELVEKYGEFLCNALAVNPKILFAGLDEKIMLNIKSMREISRFEHEFVREHRINLSWSVPTQAGPLKRCQWPVVNNLPINEFKQISQVFDDSATQEFLCEYYSKPLTFEFEPNLARFYCMKACPNSAGSGNLLLGDYIFGSDGAEELTFACFMMDSIAGQSFEAEYRSACVLLAAGRLGAERMKGKLMITNLAKSGYAPAEFALGIDYKNKWIQSNRNEDLELALAWMTKSAIQNFGAAKLELEIFGLDDWKPMAISSEEELFEVQQSAVSGNERGMYRYLTYATVVMRDKQKKSPAQVMKALEDILVYDVPDTMVFDYLRGSLQFKEASETDQGFRFIRRSANAGHPEACKHLSKIYEQINDLENAIYWMREYVANIGFYGKQELRENPTKRLYDLVRKAYSSKTPLSPAFFLNT